MATSHCLFENGKSYHALQIAQLMGRTGKAESMIRWVRDNVFSKGCVSKKVGNYYVTTGDQLNLWIDSGAEGWGDDTNS